jgi:hypothetical protein
MVGKNTKANSCLILILLTALFLLLVASNRTVAQTPENSSGGSLVGMPTLKTYSNPDLGISLQLSPLWKIEEQKNAVKLIREQNLVSLDIRSNKLEPSFTDISQYAIQDLNERQESRKDFKVLSSEESEVAGGRQGYKVMYMFTKKDTGNADKILRYWVLGENAVYTIAYDAPLDKYDSYFSEAQSMIDSIQFNVKADLESTQAISDQNQSSGNQDISNTKLSESETNADSKQETDTEFLTYQNENLRLKLEYPADWEKQEFESDVKFVSPGQDKDDPYSEVVEARVFPMGTLPFLPAGNLSVSDVASGFIGYYNQTLKNFEVIDSKPTLIGNNDAILLVLKYIDDNTGETQAMNLFTVNGDDIFAISYYAQPTSYASYSSIVTKMLLSLEIL